MNWKKLLLAGIIIRLLFTFFFNHIYDFTNILAMVKSVADTGRLTEGFFVLKRHGLDVQLYGKIFYQMEAIWLFILEKIRILDIKYIFDVKPFTDSGSYMIGIFQWTLPYYQSVAIRISQLFFDLLLLYFLYQIAKILNFKNKNLLIFFWAINFYLIFVAYAMMQADLAMLTFLAGGIYFALLEKKKTSLLFLAIGAVIKQVPLLLVPFLIIRYSKNLLYFMYYSLIFGVFYLLLNQPWSSDAALLRSFYLSSKEALAIFNFQLNGVSVFLFGYMFLFFIILFNKEKIFSKPVNLLYLTVAIISFVYISEDSSLLFPQFHVWIMPFLILIALDKNEYAIFLLAPVIGFLKRIIVDGDFLTGSLSNSLHLGSLPQYQQIFKTAFSSPLIDRSATAGMTFLYLVLMLSSLAQLKLLNFQLPENLIDLCRRYFFRLTAFILLSYFIALAIDIPVKLRYINLKSDAFDELPQEIPFLTNALSVNITNPGGYAITGFKIKGRRDNKTTGYDSLVAKFVNSKSEKLIYEQKFLDDQFPLSDEDNFLLLKKGVSEKNTRLTLFKETKNNRLIFYEARIGSSQPTDKDRLRLNFPQGSFKIQFLGQYSPNMFVQALKSDFLMKPKFYLGYFGLIIILFLLFLNGVDYHRIIAKKLAKT